MNIGCYKLVLLGFLLVVHSSSEVLTDKIKVESRLPVYINMDTAIMVFDRNSSAEEIQITMSFLEQETQFVPDAPLSITLSGESRRSEELIDISHWPDGEYKVFISETGSSSAPLVRGIRKQTVIPPVASAGPFSVGGDKLFFVDNWYFDETSGLQRDVHPGELVPIEPWNTHPELKCVRNFTRDFWVDGDGKYNVNIQAYTSSLLPVTNYWVQSNDMNDWNVVSMPASKHTDCSLTNLTETSSFPANPIYRRYDPAVDGAVDLSQVEVRYTGYEYDPMWGDIPIPYRSRIAVWKKPNDEVLVLGDPITSDKHVFGSDEIGAWSDSNDNFGDARLSSDGKVLSCYQTRLIPRHDPFSVHYDNMLCERMLVTWSTTNGVDWHPSYFDTPTLEDPWSTQHYGVDMWSEESGRLEFAYLKIYDAQQQKVYIELMYSRDGVFWSRIKNGKPFLENGARETFNYGYSLPSTRTRMIWDGCYYEPARCINVLHFMFMVANGKDDRSFITPEFYAQRFDGRMVGEYGVENSLIMNSYSSWDEICEVSKTQMFTPAFMRYRVDGWVGASPEKGRAEIVTKVLSANGSLAINAKTKPDGFVMVEVLDQYGNALEGYSKTNAAIFQGDQIGAPLTWSKGNISELPAHLFKLRITLEKSEIFTLEFIE